jgi:hypothetical protein
MFGEDGRNNSNAKIAVSRSTARGDPRRPQEVGRGDSYQEARRKERFTNPARSEEVLKASDRQATWESLPRR